MTVSEWIAAQEPPVPGGFRPWLERALKEPPEDFGALAAEASAALNRSVEGEGARDGAFELLVADALATWAAKAVLAQADAERGLEDLVRHLAG
jgi:hypothetical protein